MKSQFFNLKLFLAVNAVTAAFLFLCCKQITQHDTIEIESYSSYTSSNLPAILSTTTQRTNYDSTINLALSLIGLPNTDIEIRTTDAFGAFSIIKKESQRRFFVYSPIFFDSVYSITKTDYAILSICFHELAHQLYRHPLKPSYGSIIYEKQADRYSGFQMCINGATLEQSLIAIKYFANDSETQTHPDKASRLIEIEKGFIDAKIRIFKDSSYIKREHIFKSNELQLALSLIAANSPYMDKVKLSHDTAYTSRDSIASNTQTEQFYTLYGEPIYFTSDQKIILVSNDGIIGNILPNSVKSGSVILNLEGVQFYLENDNIFSVNPDGSKFEVGSKLFN